MSICPSSSLFCLFICCCSHGGLKDTLEYTLRCQRRALRQGLGLAKGKGLAKGQGVVKGQGLGLRQRLGLSQGQGLEPALESDQGLDQEPGLGQDSGLGQEKNEESDRFQRLSGAWQALSLTVLGLLLPPTATTPTTTATTPTATTPTTSSSTTTTATTTTAPTTMPKPLVCGYCSNVVKGGTGTPSRCSRCKSVR